jgi:flagellar motor switch protein FliN
MTNLNTESTLSTHNDEKMMNEEINLDIKGATLDLLSDIDINISIELGSKRMFIKDILKLARNSIIDLDKSAGDPLDIKANGNLIARGEVVVVNQKYGIRVTEVISRSKKN